MALCARYQTKRDRETLLHCGGEAEGMGHGRETLLHCGGEAEGMGHGIKAQFLESHGA